MREIEAINTDKEGLAKTIVAGYEKQGCRNLLTAIWGGQMDGHIATGVIEYEDDGDIESNAGW